MNTRYFNAEKNCYVLYRSKERPDYYMIFWTLRDPEKLLRLITHVGEYENSGYAHADVELACTFKTDNLSDDGAKDFIRFISEHIATDHDRFPFYDCETVRTWCKLESIEPEKWLKAYIDFKEQEEREWKKKAPPVQRSLFD